MMHKILLFLIVLKLPGFWRNRNEQLAVESAIPCASQKYFTSRICVCVCWVDCILQIHPSSSVAAVQHCISNHLKMAPYRHGGAGKGATLAADDDTSDVNSDHADEISA